MAVDRYTIRGMPRIDAPTVAEHNAMRRRQVVDAAALVLSEVGAAAFTPAAVAKQAGLARSSMYQYYPSTDALLGAAVAEMLERSRDRMIAAVAAADTPAERVTAYVREAIDDATSGHATVPDLSGMQMPEVCREGLEDAEVDNPQMASVLVRGLVNAAVSAAKHGAPREALTNATIDFVLRGVGLRA